MGDLPLDAMPDAILFVGDNVVVVTCRPICDDGARELVGRVEPARTVLACTPEGTRLVAGRILIYSTVVMQKLDHEVVHVAANASRSKRKEVLV